MKKEFKRYTVTSALPYANGPIHIGHLAGVYIPADIYCRYLRMNDKDVVFICGSDEHGVPITIKAKNEGVSPQDIVDKYHNIIKDSFERLGISFDIYSRTSNKIHHETAQEFFLTIYKKNLFVEKITLQYYDEKVNQFLADRYIIGTCPHCGNEKAYGDQCEKCGTSLNATDLINPISVLSGEKPVLRETKHWYLQLDKDEEWLKKWILEEHKDDWKANVYGQCKSWLDNGLQPRAITRDLDWGVKVPLENAEGKVLYVWFDAPIGYISATKEWAQKTGKNWELYWKDPETRLIHFIGKDNIVFHCIIFPAILKAEGSYILPDNVPANEFLNLEGEKISTSRNWAVWLNEYLDELPGKEDVLRYVLCMNAPETKDNDFTWKDYQTRNNSELVAIFGNFINRILVLTHKYFEGKLPEKNLLTEYDKEIINEIKEYPKKIGNYIENFHFRDALIELMNLARLGNKYLTDNEPWKIFNENPDKVKTIINISIQIAANLAILCRPFLPFTSDKLYKIFGLKEKKWYEAGNADLIKPETIIEKPEILFEKIEDDIIEKQINKLKQSRLSQENPNQNSKLPEIKSNITYNEFSKIDIRVGTILSAEKVAKTKKLLKLVIDIGNEKRTVVSGIAEFYQPEKIIGQKVCIIVNLEPREIKGITSQGMILMAEDLDGRLTFVEPQDKNINNGIIIK